MCVGWGVNGGGGALAVCACVIGGLTAWLFVLVVVALVEGLFFLFNAKFMANGKLLTNIYERIHVCLLRCNTGV